MIIHSLLRHPQSGPWGCQATTVNHIHSEKFSSSVNWTWFHEKFVFVTKKIKNLWLVSVFSRGEIKCKASLLFAFWLQLIVSSHVIVFNQYRACFPGLPSNRSSCQEKWWKSVFFFLSLKPSSLKLFPLKVQNINSSPWNILSCFAGACSLGHFDYMAWHLRRSEGPFGFSVWITNEWQE